MGFYRKMIGMLIIVMNSKVYSFQRGIIKMIVNPDKVGESVVGKPEPIPGIFKCITQTFSKVPVYV